MHKVKVYFPLTKVDDICISYREIANSNSLNHLVHQVCPELIKSYFKVNGIENLAREYKCNGFVLS